MAKRATSGKEPHTKRNPDGTIDTISPENHMEVFARLAKVREMHGTPGERKKKSK